MTEEEIKLNAHKKDVRIFCEKLMRGLDVLNVFTEGLDDYGDEIYWITERMKELLKAEIKKNKEEV